MTPRLLGRGHCLVITIPYPTGNLVLEAESFKDSSTSPSWGSDKSFSGENQFFLQEKHHPEEGCLFKHRHKHHKPLFGGHSFAMRTQARVWAVQP